MGRHANLTLEQHAALIDTFNRTNSAEDVGQAFAQNATRLGDVSSLSFYAATPDYPFFVVAKTSLLTIVMCNGTSSRNQAYSQAESYSGSVADYAGYPGVSPAVAVLASLLIGAFNASGQVQDRLIVFCGHSYGGAAAIVAGRKIAEQGFNVNNETVAWASPKWARGRLIPPVVNGLVETNWAVSRDVVPQLPPTLTQTPGTYALIPLSVTQSMLSYWQPVALRGMDPQGVANDLTLNPWNEFLSPRGVTEIVRHTDGFFNTMHGSSTYAAAILAYAALYGTPDPVPLPFRVHGQYQPPPSIAMIEAVTQVPRAALRNTPKIPNPSQLVDSTIVYRVRRKRRKYYVCRGRLYLGQAETKKDARTIAKAGRVLVASNGWSTPEELAGADDLLTTSYNLLFRTVLI